MFAHPARLTGHDCRHGLRRHDIDEVEFAVLSVQRRSSVCLCFVVVGVFVVLFLLVIFVFGCLVFLFFVVLPAPGVAP